jgi:hypothetical protein
MKTLQAICHIPTRKIFAVSITFHSILQKFFMHMRKIIVKTPALQTNIHAASRAGTLEI